MLLTDVAVNPYLDALFSIACLYAAIIIIFGLLALHKNPTHERHEHLRQIYGFQNHPNIRPGINGNNNNNNNAIMKQYNTHPIINFIKHFIFRSSVIVSVFMAILIIRYYNDYILSLCISLPLTVMLLSEYKTYPTKFIPAGGIIMGIIYMTVHVLGYIYGWHLGINIEP